MGGAGSSAASVAANDDAARGVAPEAGDGAGIEGEAIGAGAAAARPRAGPCARSSSTRCTRVCDSNGLVTWPRAPAASARVWSKGSNVPVRRRTGIEAVAGSACRASQTS
jgi:hypothetical protein